MSIVPPSEQDIRVALPSVEALGLVDTGGYKAVYRATVEGRVEALKLVEIPRSEGLPDEDAMRAEMRARVLREISILDKVRIPELVRLGSVAPREVRIGAGEYVVYSEEFLVGGNVWEAVRSAGPVPDEADCRRLFVVLLRAVRALWAKGFIHRDIKPKNVMRTGEVTRPFVLMDLGIAYSIDDTALTYNATARMPPATFRYIAPEMLSPRFRETIDFRSDLYTTAMTVYEYATKHHPLARSQDDLMQTITRALKQPPTPMATHRPELSAELCGLVDQMLRKKPALRPANIDAIISRLGSAQ